MEILYNIFASVFTKENLEDLPIVDEKPTVNLLETVNIERETIRKHLSKLNTTKASGPDEMHPKLLRELSEVIDEPLMFLFKKNRRWRSITTELEKCKCHSYIQKGR